MKKFIVILLILFSVSLAFALTEKPLNDGVVLASGSQTTVYTVPASTTGTIRAIWITNFTDSDATVDMWFVPSGQSIGNAYIKLSDRTIPADDILIINGLFAPLTTGYTVQAEASTATTISMQLFGFEEAD